MIYVLHTVHTYFDNAFEILYAIFYSHQCHDILSHHANDECLYPVILESVFYSQEGSWSIVI